MQAKLKAEEANRVALEAERKAAKEVTEREAAKAPKANTFEVSQTEALGGPNATSSGVLIAQPKRSENDKTSKSHSAGIFFSNVKEFSVLKTHLHAYLHMNIHTQP